MKKIQLIILIVLTAHHHLSAQISPSVIEKFPAHIVLKIKELHEKIPIDETQQIAIGERLLSKDKIANTKKAALNATSLSSYYTIDNAMAQDILYPIQLDHFLYQQNPNNRFLLALTYAPYLRLSPTKMAEIRKENERMETLPNIENTHSYCKSRLDSILTKEQVVMLTRKLYSTESLDETNKDWARITKLNLLHQKDTVAAYKALNNFYYKLHGVLDAKADKYTPKEFESVKTHYILDKQPSFLLHKKIVDEEMYYKNSFAMAVRYEKILSLSIPQRDSLLEKCKALEIIKFKNRDLSSIGVFPFEDEHLPKILNEKQMTILLAKKHEKEAVRFALDSWKTMEQLNWIADLDKKKTLDEFKRYKQRMLVITDVIRRDKNQSNLFKRRDIELNKPELLKKLETIQQTENTAKNTKNQLRW